MSEKNFADQFTGLQNGIEDVEDVFAKAGMLYEAAKDRMAVNGRKGDPEVIIAILDPLSRDKEGHDPKAKADQAVFMNSSNMGLLTLTQILLSQVELNMQDEVAKNPSSLVEAGITAAIIGQARNAIATLTGTTTNQTGKFEVPRKNI